MPALETVGQYLEEARRLLQDEITPYRYPTDDLIDAKETAQTIGKPDHWRVKMG